MIRHYALMSLPVLLAKSDITYYGDAAFLFANGCLIADTQKERNVKGF